MKKSVAEAFPPTFMVRSWWSCQLSRLVELLSRRSQYLEMDVSMKNSGVPDEADVHAQVAMDARAI